MKKISKLFAILAVLLFAASCQNNGLDSEQSLTPTLNITATISEPDATRVTYDVDNAVSHTITPAWTVGDKIIGFDDADQTFTFTVESIDGSGRASLDLGGYTQGTATKLYAIYYPGKTVSDFGGSASDYTLAVDLGTQDGAALTDDSPVLMCATADITAGSASLDFENQTAIIGVTRFKLPAAATVTSVSVAGLVTTGTIKIDGGVLVLTPGATPATVSATGSWATGEGNICETPLYFATLPTPAANIVLNASDGVNDYANLSAISSTDIEAGKYYYMAKNFASAVADVNGVKYVSIDDAWAVANAATSDVTVTLLADCASTAALTLDNTASGTGAVMLDLNGKTLSTAYRVDIKNGRSLTVTDNSSAVLAEQGRIVSTTGSKVHSVRVNANTSSFALLGGTLDNQSAALDSCYTLQVTGEATATLTGGAIKSLYRGILESSATSNLIMNGTTELTTSRHGIYINGAATIGGTTSITSSANGIVLNSAGASVTLQDNVRLNAGTAVAIYQFSGSLTITGGTYENGNNIIYINGTSDCTTTITGGTFSSTTASGALIYAKNDKCTVDISGGAFKSESTGNVLSLNDGAQGTVHGGVFFRAIPKVMAYDKSDNQYVNVLNDDAETKDDCPFALVAASATPEVAYIARTGNTDTICHGSLQSAALALNGRTDNWDFHLTSDVTTTSRVTLECAGKVNLYLDDHMITTNAAPGLLVHTDLDINDGPGHLGGITNTTTRYAVLDSITNTTVNIYGGTFRGQAKYGAIRIWGNSTTLNINGPNVLIENTGKGAALNIGGDGITSVYANIINGTIKAGSTALRCGYGTTLVTGGTFLSDTTAAATINNSAQLTIRGGYFHTGESAEEIILKSKGTLTVTGGWFSKAVNANALDPNYINDDSGSTIVGGRTYTHQVILNPLAIPIATVNGTTYYSFLDAYNAAVAYNGADATVMLTLQENVTGWTEGIDMTNASGKPIIFDLNAHTFGATVDSVLTTTGTLTITDGSGTGTGKYTSNKRKQIYLGGTGTINITNCTIECTRGGYYSTGPTYKMIAVAGTSGSKAGQINMNNAKITATSYFTPCYAYYGTLTFTNSEITCGTADAGGNYCIDVNTGGSITVNNSSFVTFPRKSNSEAYGCIYSRTGNTSAGSSIVINSGWFYGGKSIGSSQDSYSKPYTLNGGYFNTDFTSEMTQVSYGAGLSLQAITPITHNHGGTEYTYGYQVK